MYVAYQSLKGISDDSLYPHYFFTGRQLACGTVITKVRPNQAAAKGENPVSDS